MNSFKKQLGFALPVAILIVVVLIIAGGAGYYFYKTSQEQKEVGRKPGEPEKTSEIKPLDETWSTYINYELGFSMKIPKEMFHGYGYCEWVDAEESYRWQEAVVPVKIFEDMDSNIVYISSEYFYELTGKIEGVSRNRFLKCNKIINSLGLLKKGGGGPNWEIVMRKVANDSELEQFIKERYGSGCGLGEKVPTEGAIKQEGVYSVGIDTGGARDIDEMMEIGCVVNYMTTLKYFPAKNRVISWNMGQDYTFRGPKDVEYDAEMFNSFRFIEIDETANWNVYQNEEYGFEVKYPEKKDWRVMEIKPTDQDWKSEILIANSQYKFALEIFEDKSSLNNYGHLWSFIEKFYGTERNHLPLDNVGTKEFYIDSKPAIEISYTERAEDPKLAVPATIVITSSKGFLYRISYVVNSYGSQILSTFKFIEK